MFDDLSLTMRGLDIANSPRTVRVAISNVLVRTIEKVGTDGLMKLVEDGDSRRISVRAIFSGDKLTCRTSI